MSGPEFVALMEEILGEAHDRIGSQSCEITGVACHNEDRIGSHR